MFDYLKGEVVYIENALAVILDVSGVGYKIYLSDRNTLALKSRIGEELMLYVTLITKETEHALYGFLTRSERDCFNFLISLSGIGPKTGLSMLNLLTLSDLSDIIRKDDVKAIAAVPGIGKKTAEKLMVDLKSKFPAIVKTMSCEEEQSPGGVIVDHSEEVLKILMRLGYSKAGAERMISQTIGNLPSDSDVSDLLTAALRNQG